MTKTEWAASDAPQAMLRHLTHGSEPMNVPAGRRVEWRDRKLRLFACAVCRQAWGGLTDPRSRRAVEVAERQTLCRQYQAQEKVGKGPVIAVVDESGSMHGTKGEQAKGLALALAWVAMHQQRWCGLVAYSGGTGHRLLALPPGKWDEKALADWLVQFIGGGSSLDVPIQEMPGFYAQLKAPKGKTDVVFVTDAICRIPKTYADKFLAWKQEAQVRAIGLIVGSSAGDLKKVCDETHEIGSLDVTEEAVGKVLSI